MSLSSFLNQPDVRARFKQEFEKPRFNGNRTLLAPPLTENYRLVGTAFDYLMRFYLKGKNPQAVERRWVAENTLNFLQEQGANRAYEQAFLIVTQARENYAEFLETQQITDNLIGSILQLAQVDAIYRSGKIFPNQMQIEQGDIEDVRALINLVNFTQFTSPGVVLLNPTFFLASLRIGGADADIIVDDLLIDLKTTQKFELKQDDFNQLLGYYTLSQIEAPDGAPPGHEIKRLGIYFSRYAYLFTFNVADVVNPARFPQFLQWFNERAAIKDY